MVNEKVSVLGDGDITVKVRDRVMELCVFLWENGLLDSSILLGKLSYPNSANVTDYQVSDERFAALNNQLRFEQERFEELSSEYSRLVENYNQLSSENAWIREENNRLVSLNNSLVVRNTALIREYEEDESKLAELEEELSEVVSLIEENTEHIHDPWEENITNFIKSTIKILVEEIEILKVELEDE